MRSPRVSKERQQRFLTGLAEGGDIWAAAEAAGVQLERLNGLRRNDGDFSADWDAAQAEWARRLNRQARIRAVDGIAEPLVSDGKVVCDDDGTPISVQRCSDQLLLALLSASQPEKFRRYLRLEIEVHPRWLRYLIAVLALALVIWLTGDLAVAVVGHHAAAAAQVR